MPCEIQAAAVAAALSAYGLDKCAALDPELLKQHLQDVQVFHPNSRWGVGSVEFKTPGGGTYRHSYDPYSAQAHAEDMGPEAYNLMIAHKLRQHAENEDALDRAEQERLRSVKHPRLNAALRRGLGGAALGGLYGSALTLPIALETQNPLRSFAIGTLGSAALGGTVGAISGALNPARPRPEGETPVYDHHDHVPHLVYDPREIYHERYGEDDE